MDKRAIKKMLSKAVINGIHLFQNDHPNILNDEWVSSLAKRITGQVYTEYIHNLNRKKEKEVIKK